MADRRARPGNQIRTRAKSFSDTSTKSALRLRVQFLGESAPPYHLLDKADARKLLGPAASQAQANRAAAKAVDMHSDRAALHAICRVIAVHKGILGAMTWSWAVVGWTF